VRRRLALGLVVSMIGAVVMLSGPLGSAQTLAQANGVTKIKQVVDGYFRAGMESRLAGRVTAAYHQVFAPQAESKRYHEGLLRLDLTSRKYYNHLVEWFVYEPLYRSVTIHGATAEVVVEPHITHQDRNREDLFTTGSEVHTIELVQTPDGWRLLDDVYLNENTIAYPRGYNFESRISSFQSEMESDRNNPGPKFVDPRAQEYFEREEDDMSILGYTYISYDRSDGVWYAKTHTRDGTGCDDQDYNTNFVDFHTICKDCQNLVSQSVWYGFGGNDSTSSIENHYAPMVDNWTGATEWWADSGDYVSTWTVSSTFKNMATNNYSTGYGVQAYETSLDYIQWGDVVRHKSTGHAMYVTVYGDTDGDGHLGLDEVKVTAHTNNREDRPLDWLYAGCDADDFNWIKIYRFKAPTGIDP